MRSPRSAALNLKKIRLAIVVGTIRTWERFLWQAKVAILRASTKFTHGRTCEKTIIRFRENIRSSQNTHTPPSGGSTKSLNHITEIGNRPAIFQ